MFRQKYDAAQLCFLSLCDTEDWSNDAVNSASITGINYSLLYI